MMHKGEMNMTEQVGDKNPAVGPAALRIAGLGPQRISWEQRYSDYSGVEYAVRYDAVDVHYDGCAKIQFEAINSAEFPITKLDWLISCLCRIREEVEHNVKEE